MVEAKLRVELTHLSDDVNPFYGKSMTTKVVEETISNDKDERENIAPFGIKASISIERGQGHIDVFNINVNKHFFEEDELPNTYHCFFNIDGKVYELSFGVKKDQISDLTLCEWLEVGYFEDGDNADNYYYIEAFTTYFKLYL